MLHVFVVDLSQLQRNSLTGGKGTTLFVTMQHWITPVRSIKHPGLIDHIKLKRGQSPDMVYQTTGVTKKHFLTAPWIIQLAGRYDTVPCDSRFDTRFTTLNMVSPAGWWKGKVYIIIHSLWGTSAPVMCQYGVRNGMVRLDHTYGNIQYVWSRYGAKGWKLPVFCSKGIRSSFIRAVVDVDWMWLISIRGILINSAIAVWLKSIKGDFNQACLLSITFSIEMAKAKAQGPV